MTPEQLIARRRALGLSQQAFADTCQVTRRAVQDWENGTSSIRYVVGRGLEAILDECEFDAEWGEADAAACPPRRRPRAAPRLAERE